MVERLACVVLNDVVTVTELSACVEQASRQLDLSNDANRIAIAFARDMVREATHLAVGGLV